MQNGGTVTHQNGGPLSADEDFFVMVSDVPPKRQNTPEEDEADLEYFQKNLFRALKLPLPEKYKNAGKPNG